MPHAHLPYSNRIKEHLAGFTKYKKSRNDLLSFLYFINISHLVDHRTRNHLTSQGCSIHFCILFSAWRQPKPSSTPLFCDLPKTYISYLPLPQPKPPFTLLFYGLSKILRCIIKNIWLDNKSHYYIDISNKVKTIYI